MDYEEETAMEVLVDARETWIASLSHGVTASAEANIREAKKFYVLSILQLLQVLNASKP